MLHLNLADKHKGNVDYQKFTFPGGECHIRIADPFITKACGLRVKISHNLIDSNAILELALANDALRRLGHIVDAEILYFPYARQDRVMTHGEPLSVRVMADLINAMGFASVTIFDPHSDVVPALLNNCIVISNSQFVNSVITSLPDKQTVLVAPDAGAVKKLSKLADGLRMPIICGAKVRDLHTGHILSYRIDLPELAKNSVCLVVDDICDGGATFNLLGDALLKAGADSLILAVSHGIFSKGFDTLMQKYEQIYYSNSLPAKQHDYPDRIHQIGAY